MSEKKDGRVVVGPNLWSLSHSFVPENEFVVQVDTDGEDEYTGESSESSDTESETENEPEVIDLTKDDVADDGWVVMYELIDLTGEDVEIEDDPVENDETPVETPMEVVETPVELADDPVENDETPMETPVEVVERVETPVETPMEVVEKVEIESEDEAKRTRSGKRYDKRSRMSVE